MSTKAIISELKQGSRDMLKKVYLANRNEFFKFANRFRMKEEDVEDVYQDAIIVLFENAQKGKLDALNCSITTYLFSIGKYMIYDLNRKKVKMVNTKDDYVLDSNDHQLIRSFREEQHPDAYQEKLLRNFQLLGEKCKEILELFYYRGLTIDEIVLAQGYGNKNVVKSQKSRCLKSLKELIHTKDD